MTATTPFHVYAICAGSGPVVIGSYGSESEQRTAYNRAKARLVAGDYYSPDVRDIALGEDPEWRQSRGAGSAGLPGGWAAAIEQLALL